LKWPSFRGDACAKFIFWVLFLTTQGACSILLDTDSEQCNTDVDCVKRSGAFANATCVNHVCRAIDPSGPGSGGSNAGAGGAGGSGGGDVTDASSDPVWGCLGHVVMGMPQTTTVKVSVPFFDLIRMVPITDVSVRTCTKLDVSCSRPLQAPVPAGPDGLVKLDVPALFDGYGQVFSLNADDGGDIGRDG